jgi:hypothetical protein
MGSRSHGYGVVLAILVIATFILSVIAWARSRSRPSFSPAPTPSVSRQPLPSAADDLAELKGEDLVRRGDAPIG